ncbi:MAG: GTP 3',8-cyclase MoaA [Bacillota bacterium]|nr:GTP 3',8-cyclase MoaA [Bacillota bacterium]
MRDCYQRKITYLRVSVTERCNFRCFYCRPREGGACSGSDIPLGHVVRVVEAGTLVGIRKVRLTGGEPLVRKDITEITASIAGMDGIDDVALTTNGSLLRRYAPALHQAGLRRVNISLDTLKPDRFQRITCNGRFEETWDGIEAALEYGLHPVKLNTVVMRNVNDDEILDFVRLTERLPLLVRFIEVMPIGKSSKTAKGQLVTAEEIRQKLDSEYSNLEPIKSVGGDGPARYWKVPGAPGTVGFIAPLSGYFCDSCNRLRLTSSGTLRPCLCQGDELDLNEALNRGADRAELAALIAEAITRKPRGHADDTIEPVVDRLMSQIGG